MKRLLLLAPIAALALASCSNDEQIAQEITFRPIVNGTTRTVTTDANFDKFHVVATITNDNSKYAFWPTQASGAAPTVQAHAGALTSLDLDVVKNAGKWEWLGTGEVNATNYKTWYWSSKNAEASFVGYTNKGTITVPEDVATQEDVLVAYNKGVASSFDNGVPMLFRHVMSQIVIKADNKDADIRQIKVAGVRIHNIANTNYLDLPSSETTADKFAWKSTENPTGYNPWSDPTKLGSQNEKFAYYKNVTRDDDGNITGVANDGFITLNATAQEITFGGALLLLPQSISAATNLSSETAATGGFIDVLVQVQNLEEQDNTAGRYLFPKPTASGEDPNITYTQKYAWVAVPVDIAWNPGYKYTYVLHFSKDGIGKTSPDTGDGGETNPGFQPGDEVVDNPVPLYFTVVIDEWNEVEKTEKDL